MTRKFIFFSLLFVLQHVLLFSQATIKSGTWRGVLSLNALEKNAELPFNFDVTYIHGKPTLTIRNASEKIKITDLTFNNDSLVFMMPVFDTGFRLKISHDSLIGLWINYSKIEKNKIPFYATPNTNHRFIAFPKTPLDFTGQYEVTFEKGTNDEYKAIGIFQHVGTKVTGTFLTETGDYRYLEGVANDTTLLLSCFDGSHAFLFKANSSALSGKAEALNGTVLYGISGKETWEAIRNPNFTLKDPESITYLKNKNDSVWFTFKNIANQSVSLTDAKYKNKPVIIQIMGSWCPNCMDETAYLSKLYKSYNPKGLEIIALAYERTPSFEKACANVTRLKTKYNATYEFLITGLTGKAKASESLPFLSAVNAFPTTIILDKNHRVKSIYTGFNGPATGKAHVIYTKKTESLVQHLLLE